MKRLIIIILLLFAVADTATAQRISHSFNNVSMSDALKYVQQQTSKHKIIFIYNELEDFKVTTSVRSKSVPEAIKQLIGFYPIRMTQNGDEIYVECTHKSDRHLTGKIIDENGLPLEFADVRLLNPSDSSYITGGVTNASGVFVIPLDQQRVIAKFSYIGYKPVYKLCSRENVGTIQLEIEATQLGEVTVKGERIFTSAENGHIIYNMPMLLQVIPADNAYDAITRSIPGVAELNGKISFSGHPVTLIINGKPTTLTAEQVAERLKQMPADMLAKAELMPSAPPKYHIRGMAINIVTKDFTGTNQFSGQLNAGIKQHKHTSGSAGASFIYNHDKLSIDASYDLTGGTGYGQAEHEANHPLGDQRIPYSDKTTQRSDGVNHQYHIGMDYAFAETLHRARLYAQCGCQL